ncbi:MAG: mandelate racemase/muconate lactonizing enzyme family protein [Nevskiales bacterium]
MKITGIDTIRIGEFPNLLWVQVHTDEGLIGLGETFFGAAAVSAYVHESAAPYLLGKDPLHIDRHSRVLLNPILGFASTGAEMRGNSALDIALWDIFGQASNQPIHQLLGGLSRERIRIYNTCAGYLYGQGSARLQNSTGNWAMPEALPRGPYEDLDAFMHRADELAESLLAQGITGMKIWPFDPAAELTGGLHISGPELRRALEPFGKIRRAVGDRIDIMVELHSLWNLPTAKRIARALEEFEPYWFEDPIKMDNLQALADFARSTRVPVTASETLATRWAFREVLERQAAGIIMLDLSWVGGISEAKKIATMAEAHQLPVAPHDCTGPVVLIASLHLSLNAPNALIQETVRAYYSTWYRDLVTELPRIENGYAYPMTGPGLGTCLNLDVLTRSDVTVQRSRLDET